MILHEVQIPYKYGQSFTLLPLFDIHLGNKYCDLTAFRNHINQADKNTYAVGGGDMIDAIVTKDIRRYMKHSDDCESDAIIDEQIDRLYDLLSPLKGRILGLGTGNHESAINKHHGTHPMRRLAKRLDTISLGFSWLLRLRFTENGSRVRTLVIRGHHGWGGGSRTQGADLTKYSRDITYWQADMFLYGHTHKLQSDKIDRMAWIGKKLVAKPKYIYICGTFLKTYSDTDEATYSEEKGYPPVSIGSPRISITPGRRWMEIESDV